MIVNIGLPLAMIAAVVAMAGAATNSGSTQPLSDNFVISGPRRRAPAPRAQSDRLAREPAGQCTGRLRVDTVTIAGSARILDSSRPDGNRHSRQRQHHCADGAYLAVSRRRETGRRDRKHLYATLHQTPLQGKNPGKKETSSPPGWSATTAEQRSRSPDTGCPSRRA
jgi:hypothetical protein